MEQCRQGTGVVQVEGLTGISGALKDIGRIGTSDLESPLRTAAKGLSLMAKSKCGARIIQMTAQRGSCPSLSCRQSVMHNLLWWMRLCQLAKQPWYSFILQFTSSTIKCY